MGMGSSEPVPQRSVTPADPKLSEPQARHAHAYAQTHAQARTRAHTSTTARPHRCTRPTGGGKAIQPIPPQICVRMHTHTRTHTHMRAHALSHAHTLTFVTFTTRAPPGTPDALVFWMTCPSSIRTTDHAGYASPGRRPSRAMQTHATSSNSAPTEGSIERNLC